MNMPILKFKSISEFHEYFNVEKPENPLFSIIHTEYDTENENCVSTPLDEPISVTNNFYSISFKHIISGELTYGHTKYDCKNGTMLFMAPNQTVTFKDIVISSESYHIAIHKDYIRKFDIYEKIKSYNFFNYNVNEALHLTPKEEEVIKAIFKTIKTEYHNNQDEFSKEIIISQLETLLKYSDRFYNRQFLNRKEISSILLDKFNAELRGFYSQHQITIGTPDIDTIAKKLAVSKRYLSDTLKKETGKSAKEHINLFITEKAKDKLLGTSESVSEIAYELGFEYPQHFSKVFKKQTGKSPKEYRLHSN